MINQGTAGKIMSVPGFPDRVQKITRKVNREPYVYDIIRRKHHVFKNFRVLTFLNIYEPRTNKSFIMDKMKPSKSIVFWGATDDDWLVQDVPSIDGERLAHELGIFHRIMLQENIVPWETELFVQGDMVVAIDFEKFGRIVENEVRYYGFQNGFPIEQSLVCNTYPLNTRSNCYTEAFIAGLCAIEYLLDDMDMKTIIDKWININN